MLGDSGLQLRRRCAADLLEQEREVDRLRDERDDAGRERPPNAVRGAGQEDRYLGEKRVRVQALAELEAQVRPDEIDIDALVEQTEISGPARV